ncbi:hypothetical protein A7K69_09880 [Parageobacillus thermoglucosidasius]|uniref:Uncharacterized protein n=1 Tax=Parageobacillus thermoglucosidasius TaxID=1426 RepID=A0A1B7KQR2_PARTM|nr:hypothetical protein A7K69_09880 [Parageobacillus thermoglucosidasius]
MKSHHSFEFGDDGAACMDTGNFFLLEKQEAGAGGRNSTHRCVQKWNEKQPVTLTALWKKGRCRREVGICENNH